MERHFPSDLEDVADWLGVEVEQVELRTELESIEPFLAQIREMEGTYLEFPQDAKRTARIERQLRAGEVAMPIYIEDGDQHNFVMEGRHRMVAFLRLGMREIPVCRVRTRQAPLDRQTE